VPSPVDRRLLRETRAARPHLVSAGALGVVSAGLIIAQAILLASVIAAAALDGATLHAVRGRLIALAAVLAARAVVTAGFELSGRLGAARVMSELRGRLVRHLLILCPGGRPGQRRSGELAAAAVQGVDALEDYFAGYLPQLTLATVVPVAILVWVAMLDPISAVILAVTVPLLIVFMILIGKGAKAQTHKRWQALSVLSAHFLDVVRGLATLRAYRREQAQEDILADVGDRYRRETMATLRVAFLSALVLELCAMIGTAIAAATIGVQLIAGALTLQAGLTVLLLAPELYGPLRQVGQQFHASAAGTAAAEEIFATLDQAPVIARAPHGAGETHRPHPVPDPGREPIRFRAVHFSYPERAAEVLSDVELELEPGELTALVGPSGAGKSTIARLLMRLADPTHGAVTCGEVDLRGVDVEDWQRHIAWVPQRPRLFEGSVAENIRLSNPTAGDEQVLAAVRAAGAGELIAGLPAGLATPLGERGRRLSAGQRQRIALARAFLRDAPLLVLDEPTAHLDPESAEAIAEAVERLTAGRTTLSIVHHEAFANRASRIVHLDAGRVLSPPAPAELAA
jgi:thiol reductant ABC exporter CydD subunit